MTWSADASAVELLEHSGNPFDTRAYRRAFVGAYPSWRDATFGGVSGRGVRAAVALLAIEYQAESVPLGYGGVLCDGPLGEQEKLEFLEVAREAARVSLLRCRWVPGSPDAVGRRFGTTAIVTSRADTDPVGSYNEQGRRSLRKAEASGATVSTGSDPEVFLGLYGASGKGTRYSASMLSELASAGLLTFTDVFLGAPVASAAVLRGTGHRLYWLGAQSDAGREVAASYLALTAVLRDARDEGIPFVNLGGSEAGGNALEGVARFKRNLGGVEVPLLESTLGREGVPWEAPSMFRRLFRRS